MTIITTPLARQNVLLLVSKPTLRYLNPVRLLFETTEAKLPITITCNKYQGYTKFDIWGIKYPLGIFVTNRKIPLLFRKKSQKNPTPKKAKLAP